VSNPTGLLPSNAYDLTYPTIYLALDVSELAYETYGLGNVLTRSSPKDPSEGTLLSDGWIAITAPAGSIDASDHYQGVAFYKVIGGGYRVDLSLVQPIFPFVTERSAIAKAKAEVKRAEALTTEARIEADSKFRTALSATQEANSSYRAARASMAEAESVLKLTESLFKAGRSNLDDFEHAEIDLQKSVAEVETLASHRRRAAWDLERAVHAANFPAQLMRKLGIDFSDDYLPDGS
jgi:Outer membrane efflux protein